VSTLHVRQAHGQTLRRGLLVTTLLLGLLVLAAPIPVSHAFSVVELSPSNGSTTCPTYFRGVDTQAGVWNASTLTCTLIGNPKASPNFCVSSSAGPGLCSLYSIDELVIDSGVTFVMVNSTGMAVYSELVNNGTVVADITIYGTIVNNGVIDLTGSNQLLNLGTMYNMQDGTINNYYSITNPSRMVNYGTINNYGQFVTDECCPAVYGTFVNNGTYIGSAPAPSVFTTVSVQGNTTEYRSVFGPTTIVAVYLPSDTNATVSSQAEGATPPAGFGAVGLNSSSYFDLLVTGSSEGIALVCITSNNISSSPPSNMQYWNRTNWVGAENQNVSGTVPPLTLCGDIPVSALSGTPITVGMKGTATHTNTIATTDSTTRGPGSGTATVALYIWIGLSVAAVVIASVLAVRISRKASDK
jgi:hypothetical protein